MFIRRLLLDEAQAVGVDWRALGTSVILGEEVLVETQRDYIAARMGIAIDHDPHRLVGSSFGVGELGLNLLFETREPYACAAPCVATRPWRSCCAAVRHRTPCPRCSATTRCAPTWVLNPDANGFGELCITMLGAGNVIALPRYATGDMARLVPGRTHNRPLPWPVCRPRGCPWRWCRAHRDRRTGLPSVEAIRS